MKKQLCLFLSLALCLTCLSIPVFASDSRPLTDEDYYTGSVENPGPVEVRLGAETYWIGPAHHGNPLITQSGAYGDGSAHWSSVGLWKKTVVNDLTSYTPVPDAALLVEQHITGLSLTIKALPGTESAYPAVTDAPENGILGTNFALSSNQNAGDWVVLVTGQADGEAFTAFGRTGVWPPEQNFPYNAVSVQDANDWLMKQVNVPTYTYIVSLPSGELTGTITIPEHLGKVSVRGQIQNNQPATILNGGIYCGAYNQCMINDLELRGAGKENKTWPGSTTPNYGIYGPSRAWMRNLHFSGYDRAVSWENNGVKFGMVDSTFDKNLVALYVNCEHCNGGNTMIENCKFLNNDIAIDLHRLPQEIMLNYYRVVKNCFIGNKTDIRNQIGRRFFLPGNYFSHPTLQDDSAAVSPAVIEGDEVLLFPVAADENFSAFDYGEREPVVSNSLAWDFPIPADALNGKTISVIDQSGAEDIPLAEITLQASQTGLSLLSEETAAFIPTVSRAEKSGSFTLSMQTIPDGYTASITVPCPEGWTDAIVLADGIPLDSDFSEGAVHFTVPKGQTQFSIHCVPKTTLSDGQVSYTVQDLGDQPFWVLVTQYDKTGRMKDLADSYKKEDSFRFAHADGDQYRLFLLSPDSNAPLCISKALVEN